MKIRISTYKISSGKTWLVLLFFIMLLPGQALGTENIQENIPFSTAIVLERAQNLIQADKPSQAIDILETFKKNLTNKKQQVHPFFLFTLANYYMEDQQPEKAVPYYEDCVQMGTDFSPAWLNLAKASYDLGLFHRAGQCFVKGYELEKNKRAVLLYYAANSFFSSKEYSTALTIFNRLTKYHTEKIEPVWHELAVHILLALEQPENALPHMEFLAKNLDGTARTTWQETLLYHYMELGMDQKALEFVSFLTREYPLEPRWWKGLARFSLDKNQLTKALAALTLYGFLTPLTDNEKKLMADLYLAVGIPSRAVEFYEQIPAGIKRVENIQNRVVALRQMNLDQRALELIDQGIKKEKSSIELKRIKGDLLFTMGRFKEAAALFEILADKDESGHAWLMLGYSRWNLGEIKNARTAMEKAVTFTQQKKAAARALKSLSPHN